MMMEGKVVVEAVGQRRRQRRQTCGRIILEGRESIFDGVENSGHGSGKKLDTIKEKKNNYICSAFRDFVSASKNTYLVNLQVWVFLVEQQSSIVAVCQEVPELLADDNSRLAAEHDHPLLQEETAGLKALLVLLRERKAQPLIRA